jgi:hypothetical protein
MRRKFKTYWYCEREDVRRAFLVHCRDRDLSEGSVVICSQRPFHLARTRIAFMGTPKGNKPKRLITTSFPTFSCSGSARKPKRITINRI